MSVITIQGFSGEIPRLIPRLLPQAAGASARDCRLEDGSLSPVRVAAKVGSLPPAPPTGYKTLYRNGNDWLAWGDEVFALPGPVAADRLYVFGDGVPKKIIGGTEYGLKVDRPAAALTVSLAGSPNAPGQNVTRLYVYVNVTQFGEPSRPSPVSAEVDWSPGQVPTLSGFSTTMSGDNVATTQRIYRSQTGQTGTQLYFIAERAASTGDFTDNVAVDDIGEPLPSADYNEPPDDLTGVIAMPNGMMAGFVGNDVYFCEPYLPHAWPEKYVMTVDFPIVALGAYGTTLVVMTEGNPYVMDGASPDAMQSAKLELNLPCINSRGVQDLGYTIAYPSNDGLVLVSNGSAVVGSSSLYARTDWQQMGPSRMVSGQAGGRYFSRYDYVDKNGIAMKGTLIFDVTGEQPFIIESDLYPDAFFYDKESGLLYYVEGDEIFLWDAQGQVKAEYSWRSKDFLVPTPTNFGAILVDAEGVLSASDIQAIQDAIDLAVAQNVGLVASGNLMGEINGDVVGSFPVNGDVLVPVPRINQSFSLAVYADDVPVATVNRLNQMARLPSGFKARKWAVSVLGTVNITQIALATTATELQGV